MVMGTSYSLVLDSGHITMATTGEWSQDGRALFAYTISDGEVVLGRGADFRGAVGREESAEEMTAALLDFLGACAEAQGPESENWDLFNEATRTWAKANSDELAIAAVELEEASKQVASL